MIEKIVRAAALVVALTCVGTGSSYGNELLSNAFSSTDETARVAEQWIETGKPGQALTLLHHAVRAARAVGADTTVLRFLAAQAYLKMRRFGAAEAVLRRLAEEHPDIDRFRLDHAAALYALGRDDEAGAMFWTLRRRENLPPTVRRNVEKYLERIRSRQRWRVDLDLGAWHDNNVNNAPERETVEVPLFGGVFPVKLNDRPVRAWVARTGAQLRWRSPAIKGVPIETRASVARNTALGASAYNRTWMSLSSGPRRIYTLEIAGRRRTGLANAELGVERRWHGGDGYAASLWVGSGVDQSVAEGWRAGGSVRAWMTHYDGEAGDVRPHGATLGLHVRRRVGPGWITAGIAYSRERPKRRSLRWMSREAILSGSTVVRRDWNLSARIKLSDTKFEGTHPLFQMHRRDRTRGFEAMVSNRNLAWEGYLPEVKFTWTRTNSTIPLYDRKLQTLQIGFRRLF